MDLAFVIIMGGLWGSFANVCIYRLPEQKSVVSGRSFCPNCKKKIVNNEVILESLIAFKRAGANAIISYYADRLDQIIR